MKHTVECFTAAGWKVEQVNEHVIATRESNDGVLMVTVADRVASVVKAYGPVDLLAAWGTEASLLAKAGAGR